MVTTGPYKSQDMELDAIPGDLLVERIALGNEYQCWEWLGTKANGRPVIQIDGRRRNVKRLLWMWWNQRPVPDGTVVSQTCGNGVCVSPHHLMVNSQAAAVSRGMARSMRERAAS